ncbi:Ribose import ATP-binding protein RbsA [subsurface metagenome]
MTNGKNFVLKVKNIRKEFPGVLALDDVNFDLKPGEIHALLGENGAGKSTLIKIISGVYKAEAGEIIIDGQKKVFNNPHEALNNGISTIYQEFNLVPYMNVSENIYLGKEDLISEKFGILNRRKMENETKELLNSINLSLDPNEIAKGLGIAKQQLLSIAKAIFRKAKVIIMDEPSAVLTTKEFEYLLDLIRGLKSEGIAIIYISHRIEEIFQIADRVTVLRNGKLIETNKINKIDIDQLIKMMVGRRLEEKYHKATVEIGSDLFKVENINRKNILKNISFTLRKGEILGITGLVGAGKTELARAIFGADKIDSGIIKINNEVIEIDNPSSAINNKISFIPEDRKNGGLVLEMSVQHNITLANLNQLVKTGIINLKKEKEIAREFKDKLSIKTPTLERKTLYLSGGNQQKVVIAKCIFTDAHIFIFDEATRGIDVGAKIEVYDLIIFLHFNYNP